MKTEYKIGLIALVIGLILGNEMEGTPTQKEATPEAYLNDTICETNIDNETVIFER